MVAACWDEGLPCVTSQSQLQRLLAVFAVAGGSHELELDVCCLCSAHVTVTQPSMSWEVHKYLVPCELISHSRNQLCLLWGYFGTNCSRAVAAAIIYFTPDCNDSITGTNCVKAVPPGQQQQQRVTSCLQLDAQACRSILKFCRRLCCCFCACCC